MIVQMERKTKVSPALLPVFERICPMAGDKRTQRKQIKQPLVGKNMTGIFFFLASVMATAIRELFLQATINRMRGHGLKMCQEKYRLDVRKKIKYWNWSTWGGGGSTISRCV